MSSAGRRPPLTWRVPLLAVMSRPEQYERGPAERGPDGPGVWPRTGAARRWAVDVAIAVAVTAAQVGGTYAGARWQPGHGSVSPLGYVLLAVGGVSLLARRRYPVGVLAVTLGTTLWASAGNEHAIYLALIVAFFTATLERKRAGAVTPPGSRFAWALSPRLFGEP